MSNAGSSSGARAACLNALIRNQSLCARQDKIKNSRDFQGRLVRLLHEIAILEGACQIEDGVVLRGSNVGADLNTICGRHGYDFRSTGRHGLDGTVRRLRLDESARTGHVLLLGCARRLDTRIQVPTGTAFFLDARNNFCEIRHIFDRHLFRTIGLHEALDTCIGIRTRKTVAQTTQRSRAGRRLAHDVDGL